MWPKTPRPVLDAFISKLTISPGRSDSYPTHHTEEVLSLETKRRQDIDEELAQTKAELKASKERCAKLCGDLLEREEKIKELEKQPLATLYEVESYFIRHIYDAKEKHRIDISAATEKHDRIIKKANRDRDCFIAELDKAMVDIDSKARAIDSLKGRIVTIQFSNPATVVSDAEIAKKKSGGFS